MIVLTFLILAAGTFAQDPSPREQFQAAVAAFQKNATEDNARKLAEIAKQLAPAPAVPEDAEFHALKGAAYVKQAADTATFAKAAAEFRAAIATAPWVGEYHYNLTVCEKSAGNFAGATAALKFAQIYARTEQERHDNLALRADLETAQEIAESKKNLESKAAETKRAVELAAKLAQDRFLNSLDGGIWHQVGAPDRGGIDVFLDVHGRELEYYSVINPGTIMAKHNPQYVGVRKPSWKTTVSQKEFTLSNELLAKFFSSIASEVRITISDDGQTIIEQASGSYPYRRVYLRIK